jgi:hypothetical protein
MELILAALAVYYVTTVLTSADGMCGVFAKLRGRISMLSCFVCTSVYVSAVIALFNSDTFLGWLLTSAGLAGAAVLADRHTMNGL